MKDDSKSMKAIAIVTMAFLPLATIAVRKPTHCPRFEQSLTVEAGDLRLSILQFRFREQKDPGRD